MLHGRGKHSPAFTAKVALEALKDQEAVAQLTVEGEFLAETSGHESGPLEADGGLGASVLVSGAPVLPSGSEPFQPPLPSPGTAPAEKLP